MPYILLSPSLFIMLHADSPFTDTLLVSVGYDLDVNIWCMNSHQLKNTYKVNVDNERTCFVM